MHYHAGPKHVSRFLAGRTTSPMYRAFIPSKLGTCKVTNGSNVHKLSVFMLLSLAMWSKCDNYLPR